MAEANRATAEHPRTRLFLLTLAVFSTTMLTWQAIAFLGTPLWRDPGDIQPCSIVAPGPSDRAPEAVGSQIWIPYVTIDGIRKRWDELERTGDWALQYGWLTHGSDQAASVSFQARSAVVELLTSAWSGRARFSSGASSWSVDLYCSASNGRTHVDLPAFQRPSWAWLVFAMAAGTVLFLVRPWSSSRRTVCWLFATIVASHTMVWAGALTDTNNDSIAYLPHFRFNVEHAMPMYFPPGYGMLQAALDSLPGHLGTKVTLIQHVLAIATICMIWRMLRTALPSCLSLLWLASAPWLAPVLLTPQTILSENLAQTAMVGAVYFAHRYASGGSLMSGLLAGSCLGLGTIARVVPLAASGPGMLLLALAGGPRVAVVRCAWMFGVALLWIGTPILWFWAHGHQPSLSNSVGRHMYNRLVVEQDLVDDEGPTTKEVQGLLPGVDLSATYHWDLWTALAKTDQAHRAEELINGIADEAMRRHRLDYIAFTIPLAWRNLSADPSTFLQTGGDTPHFAPHLESTPFLGFHADTANWTTALRRPFGRIWKVLCWLSTAALLLVYWLPERRTTLAWLLIPFLYILATSAVEFHLARYNVAITPIVAAGGMLPLAFLLTKLRRTPDAANPVRVDQGPGSP